MPILPGPAEGETFRKEPRLPIREDETEMITAAWKAILLSLLLTVPTADARATSDEDDDKVVVQVGDDDVDVHGVGPIVVRVGSRGFIGVTLVEITPELRAHYGAPKEAGVVVSGVEADTPAGRAGIQVGDVITSVDGKRARWSGDISRAVRDKKAGETVEVEIVRDRAPRKVTVTVEERKGRERSFDFRDFGDKIRRHAWVDRDFDGIKVIENLDDLRGMRERLEDLEKRLKELEKRLAK